MVEEGCWRECQSLQQSRTLPERPHLQGWAREEVPCHPAPLSLPVSGAQNPGALAGAAAQLGFTSGILWHSWGVRAPGWMVGSCLSSFALRPHFPPSALSSEFPWQGHAVTQTLGLLLFYNCYCFSRLGFQPALWPSNIGSPRLLSPLPACGPSFFELIPKTLLFFSSHPWTMISGAELEHRTSGFSPRTSFPLFLSLLFPALSHHNDSGRLCWPTGARDLLSH